MSESRRVEQELSPSDQELAVGATVLYSSLFEYPLSEEEVRRGLMFFPANGDSISEIYSRSSWLKQRISVHDGFFVPSGREEWVRLRQRRRKSSLEFIKRHERLLEFICSLPFTRLVALSGSVSHLNIDSRADLDLMVITQGSRVWSVAVAAILLARAFGSRQSICVNFLLGEERLKIEGEDLFSASQMIHLRPLIDSDLLPRFFEANSFIWEFFPDFRPGRAEPLLRPGGFLRTLKKGLEVLLSVGPGQILEWTCRQGYSRYLMAQAPNWMTADQVRLDRDCLKLHSQSHRRRVLRRFETLLIQGLGEPECWRVISRMRSDVPRSDLPKTP